MPGFFCRIVRLDSGTDIGLYSKLLLLDASLLLGRTFVERERREAPSLLSEGRAPSHGAQWGLASPAKGVSPTPWRLPALHPPFLGNGKRDTGAPGAIKNTGEDACLHRAVTVAAPVRRVTMPANHASEDQGSKR